MVGFKRIPDLSKLSGAYPDAFSLRDASIKGGKDSRVAIARLWLSEGIPYAFQDCPDVYESMRTWLAVRLTVDPNEISMTGSGRIGQSLHPDKIGRSFSNNSDLDLFVVSNELFNAMSSDALLWCSEYENGIVAPINDSQKKYWPENLLILRKNIKKGFVDSDKVPYLFRYKTISDIANAMSELKIKLGHTNGAPIIRKSSVRCYRSWQEFVDQVAISLPRE